MKNERAVISLEKLTDLPDAPGVYFFIGKNDTILYIGRATNLRSRVRSYFAKDITEKRSPLIASMVAHAVRIEYQVTDSVLEAVVLEPYLIKKYLPAHNTKDKSDRSFVYLIITKEDFPRLLIKRQREILEKKVTEPILYSFGPFTSRRTLEQALKIIRKIFPFYSRRQSYDGKSNVYQQIGLAPGTGMSREEYRQTIGHIKLFFEGKKKRIISELKKQMYECAKDERFEAATIIKKRLFALEHIHDVSLISDDYRDNRDSSHIRIEAYDVAHLQGTHAVGVMVVLYGENPDKQEYRKFKIKSFDGIDDNRALQELLERRFKHEEWEHPQLIIADGSVAQLRTTERYLQEHGIENVYVVACKKDKTHKVAEMLGDRAVIAKYRQAILLANSEAHRFAIEYHKTLRDKNFIANKKRTKLS